jgi:hypothetical protein
VGLGVLTTVTTKTVVMDVTPYSLAEVQHFFYQTTWGLNPEDSIFQDEKMTVNSDWVSIWKEVRDLYRGPISVSPGRTTRNHENTPEMTTEHPYKTHAR